jgi:chromosome segregation ATPase
MSGLKRYYPDCDDSCIEIWLRPRKGEGKLWDYPDVCLSSDVSTLEKRIAKLEAEVRDRSNEVAHLLAENAQLREDKEELITDLRNRVKELNLKLSTCFPVSHQYTEIRARKEAFETVIAELEEGGEG